MAHLTHPDSGQEITVRADQVPLYMSQGWGPVKPGRKPSEPAEDPAPETE